MTRKKGLLRLYVAGTAPNSVAARDRLSDALREEEPSCEVEIVDVMETPERALEDHVLVTPTLVRVRPLPQTQVFGNLSDRQALERLLEPLRRKGRLK